MPDDDANAAPFKTAAELLGIGRDQPPPTPGMSYAPGLRPVENSLVPNTDRSHVMGPGQAACDPVLAGLDTNHIPMTRAENRGITRIDGQLVAAPLDTESDKLPGPNSTSAPAAPNAVAEAAKVTPTVVLPSAGAAAPAPGPAPVAVGPVAETEAQSEPAKPVEPAAESEPHVALA